ncbi:hypothetical protein U1E44_14820 [Arenibacter sp. GZD96]|uniref:hypothetical protein n=1 Tax=Aurantibrevibacter litoralis TaxID=3106030 RepID=UPI002AFF139E|nr:hypothetical protein [Arenibacter sp. GZD-96]MEA1787371.1 hypothetical protein [Arenibacter sp. GZD-96]
MKITYFSFVMAFIVISCSESEISSPLPVEGESVDVTYTLLLQSNGSLSSMNLHANRETITAQFGESAFPNEIFPEHIHRNQNELSWYSHKTDCKGKITVFNFETATLWQTEAFNDFSDCDLTIHAISHSDTQFFIAYEVTNEGKEHHYNIRLVSRSASGENPVTIDIPIAHKPIQLLANENRLFVLTGDEEESNTYVLKVLNLQSQTWIHEKNLGEHVQKIIKTDLGHVLIAYPRLHSIVDANTLINLTEVRYNEGFETKLGEASSEFLHGDRMFFARPSALSPNYDHVPAVYTFETNTVILFLYENFLSVEEREFLFEIEDTTLVAYDHLNDVLLIGYRKKGIAHLGGILRITLGNAPKLIDHTNLNGVPYAFFMP